jgi:hypothetical protein
MWRRLCPGRDLPPTWQPPPIGNFWFWLIRTASQNTSLLDKPPI